MGAELPGGAENAPQRAAHEIIDDPAERPQDLPRQRPAHVGADMMFQTKKIVAGRDLPARRTHLDRPMRQLLGIDLDRLERQADRPDLAEAVA